MPAPTPEVQPDRLVSAMAETRIGFHLGRHIEPLWALGFVQSLVAGQTFAGCGSRAVHVMLRGRLASAAGVWHGPGNHFTVAGERLTALDNPTAVWTLDPTQYAWRAPANQALRAAWARALRAAQADERAAGPPSTLPDPRTLCDQDHPAIRSLASSLRGETPAASARAIFHTIQQMPYRFGLWQETASRTLARGSGMCTTKANLQVALLRALDIEAGFVEVPLDIGVLGVLMPEAWRVFMRSQVKHYFAAVRLGGRWHPADASFCAPSCRLFTEAAPYLGALVPCWFDEGRPFHPVAYIQGTDPFDIQVLPQIHAEMGKQSRFLPRHFEAMNTRLDHAGRCMAPDGQTPQPAPTLNLTVGSAP